MTKKILLLILSSMLLLAGCSIHDAEFNRDMLIVNQNISPEKEVATVSTEEVEKDSKTITALGAAGWMPYVFAADEGVVPGGAAFEILERSLEGTGYNLEVQPAVGWNRLLELVKTNEIDVLTGIYYNDERAEIYKFSEPFAIDKVAVFVKKGAEFEFNTLDDLKGKVALMPEGASYGEEFDAFKEENLKVREVDSSQAFDLLLSGAGDFYLSAYTDVQAKLISQGLEDQIIALDKSIKENNVYFIFGIDNPKAEILPQVNENLKEMLESGEIDRILINALIK